MTFDDYKQLNLADFATQHGYRQDPKKSSRTMAVLKKDGDVIVVMKNDRNGEYYYYNPNNSSDKGNIIQFTIRRFGLDLKNREDVIKLNELLSGFSPSSVVQVDSYQSDLKKAPSKSFEIKPLTDRGFLHKRMITDKTLEHPCFKNRVFNAHKTDREKGVTYINTAFPMYSPEGKIIGLEIKNEHFKGNEYGSQKSNSLWLSNFPEKMDTLVIGESAVDLLSYFQLFEKQNPKSGFVSTNGNIASEQFGFLNKVIADHQPAQVVLVNDNDLAGLRNNINIIGSLGVSNGQDVFARVQLNTDNGHQVQLEVRVKGDLELPADSNISRMDYIKGFFPDFYLKESGISNGHVYRFVFENDMAMYKKAERGLIGLKKLEGLVQIKRAVEKDFNDDLKKKSLKPSVSRKADTGLSL